VGNVEVVLWIGAALAAGGTGVVLYHGLVQGTELVRMGIGRRRRTLQSLEALVRRGEREDESLISEEDLHGLPANLVPWMVLAAGVGLVVSLLALTGPARFLGLVGGVAPLLWKNRRLAQARLEVRREVHDLIEEVRLRMPLFGTLAKVLHSIIDEEREGIVYRRLSHYSQMIAMDGPEAVLERLAAELRSPELRMLMRRVRAARRGGTPYAEALDAASSEVVEEMQAAAEVEVAGAPLRLMLPMLVCVFPPVLALLLYPPAAALLAQVTGPRISVGSGF
jgi:Flp pilus assembly protein TadB